MKSRGSDSFLMLCRLDRQRGNDLEGGNIGLGGGLAYSNGVCRIQARTANHGVIQSCIAAVVRGKMNGGWFITAAAVELPRDLFNRCRGCETSQNGYVRGRPRLFKI